MYRALLTALFVSTAVPAFAQQDAPAPAATPASDAAPAAPALTPEQITAFNQAVADFGEGQKAQQANDNATASTKYAAALPAIRDVVKAQPDNMDNVNFLANALYANAASELAQQKTDQGIALMEESIPYWRKVVASKPADATSQTLLASITTQIGNVKLSKQDKAGAAPLYAEALDLSRKLVAAKPDAASKNLLLSALIGASQTSDDASIKTEVAALSKSMLADGSVDATNKPAAQILAGTPATAAAK